jgi:uncharacterized protein YjbJ (UPF0337 family)
MSIASDIRSYADTAVTQGKQVLDSSIASAQAQLDDVTGQANEFYGKTKDNVSDIAGKAAEAVNDLRASAEKAINIDAIKSAVEPYLAQVKDYTGTVTDRAEGLLSGITADPRVAKLVETVQDRVVKPVQSLTGIATKPTVVTPTPKAAAKPARKPSATKPAATKPASKPTVRKAPAKRTATS